MNSELRNSLDILNTEINQYRVILYEGDFVDGLVELTDNQIKQIFMILSQAAVYKKIQGSIQGYTPPFKVDKVPLDTDIEDVINEASIFSKMKDAFVDRFGSKGDKMAMVARNTSSNILKQWEADSISGGIPSTIEAVGTWIKNKGVDADIIDLAFMSIGVPNIQNTIGAPEVESEPSAVERWLNDELLLSTAFTGALAKDFLTDSGVSEERANTMLARMGVKSGRIISKDQYGKLDAVAQKFGGEKKPSGEETPTTDWPAHKVRSYILDKYEIDPDHLDIAFDSLGLDMESEAPIGDNVLRKLTNAIVDQVPEKDTTVQSSDAIMDKTQQIVKKFGGTMNKAISVGKKAKATNNFTDMSELQKLGIAVLTARKKL